MSFASASGNAFGLGASDCEGAHARSVSALMHRVRACAGEGVQAHHRGAGHHDRERERDRERESQPERESAREREGERGRERDCARRATRGY